MKKAIIGCIILAATNLASWYIGSHDIIVAEGGVHVKNLKASLAHEREYANALLEGLHRFYGSDDNDTWFEDFMPTKEYKNIERVNGGNWEDFYQYETTPLGYDDEL